MGIGSSSTPSRQASRNGPSLTASPLANGSQGHPVKQSSAFNDLFGTLSFEQKLAPKNVTGNEDDPECPICFLNYESLNEMTCCKANVCTNCYTELRQKNSKTPTCPFCSQTSFSVVYRSSTQSASKQAFLSASAPTTPINPNMAKSNGSTPDSSTNGNSGGKLRSGSLGSSPIVTASISDRQDLEKEMRKLRESARATSAMSYRQQSSGNYRGNGSSSNNNNRLHIGNSATARRQTTGGINTASSLRQLAESQARAATASASASGGAAADGLEGFGAPSSPSRRNGNGNAAPGAPAAAAAADLESQLAFLQFYLGSGAATGANADEVEDLLLMEAINLSLQESFASASTTSSTAAPAAPSSSSSSAAPIQVMAAADPDHSYSSSDEYPSSDEILFENTRSGDGSGDGNNSRTVSHPRSDSEAEQLALALSMSLQGQSQPAAAAAAAALQDDEDANPESLLEKISQALSTPPQPAPASSSSSSSSSSSAEAAGDT